MSLAITFLTYNNNELLFSTIRHLFEYTDFTLFQTIEIHILAQCCHKSYLHSLENVCKHYEIPDKLKCILHTSDENLGISRGMNVLYEHTSTHKYVLHLEDDWVLLAENKDWLYKSYSRMIDNPSIATLALRKYGTDKEKWQYGWTRTIPYKCHVHPGNFNYEKKIETTDDPEFRRIKHFLFTANPVIRNNTFYSSIYPLPDYHEQDSIQIYKDGVKVHDNPRWGTSEAETMEKTRDFITEYYQDGVFVHFDDWVDYLKKNKLSLFSNHFVNQININCHIPVLVIHLDNHYIKSTRYAHDYLRFVHYIWDDDFEQLKKVFSQTKPQALISIGKSLSEINKYTLSIPFDIRKRWIHLASQDDIRIPSVEHCIFYSHYKHPYIKDNPVVSVITPAYKSEHRIFRPFYSLLNQTYTNWQWIILSDSPDDEKEWKQLTEFASNDSRIEVYRRPKNDGSIGRNKLFCGNLARGNFVFELDHDDEILPQTFDILIHAAIKHPDCGFFYSDFIKCFEDTLDTWTYGDNFSFGFGSYYRTWYKNKFHYVCNTSRINPHTIRHIVGVPNHFRCWTKQAYTELKGHNPDLQVADDYDLIVRTMLKYRWCHIREMLYIQYINQGGNNFTFYRNQLIQYLVQKIRNTYEEDIHTRLVELNVNDDVHGKWPDHPKDYEVKQFEYPILEKVYRDNDTDDSNPMISIVMPTYNRPDHLKRALDSIFRQTYQNFEILLVGDKCPVLDQFVYGYEKAKDKRFKYYNLLHNYGPGGAVPRNYAIKMMCSTKWIAYLDDDNEWKENHLEHLVEAYRKNKNASYFISSMMIDGKELLFDEPKLGRIDTSCVMHSFDLCVKYGLWKDRIEGGYAHDWEFFSRWKNESYVATHQYTLLYNTEFNGQSFDFLNNLYK